MAEHLFDFEGGEKLAKIGASWFVSYSYYRVRDETHMNWKKISTYSFRISVFNGTSNFHQFWLRRALDMDNALLKRNKIGLTGTQVKQMASELLASAKGD
jgi:hypothetical protein